MHLITLWPSSHKGPFYFPGHIMLEYNEHQIMCILPCLWPYRSHNWSVVLRKFWYTLSLLIEWTLSLWISDDHYPVTGDSMAVRQWCLHCTTLNRQATCVKYQNPLEAWVSIRNTSKIPVVRDELGMWQVQPGSVPMKFGARVCRAIHDMPRGPSRKNSLICTGPNSPISLNTWLTSIRYSIDTTGAD